MVFEDQQKIESNPWRELRNDLESELNETQEKIQSIERKLQQSQSEVKKLADRNASVTGSLQRLQKDSGAVPYDELSSVYESALEVQQRLLVMRGQAKQLENEKKYLANYRSSLERVTSMIEGGAAEQVGAQQDAYNVIEAIIQAQETERQRLSRQMHDGPAQALSNFILQAEIATRLFDVDPDKAREELDELKKAATKAFQQVRNFVFELRPMMLDDLGLVPTLKRYIEAFKEQTGVEVDLSVTGVERRLESHIEVIIFRSIQELLGFSFRQSQADQINIVANIGEANVKVSLEDNGDGIDEELLNDPSGLTVKAIKDRIEMLGGFMDIDSQPAQGGYILFQIPVGTASKAVFSDL